MSLRFLNVSRILYELQKFMVFENGILDFRLYGFSELRIAFQKVLFFGLHIPHMQWLISHSKEVFAL